MARPKMVHTGVVFNSQTIDVGAVGAASVLIVPVTVKGARLGHPVVVWAPSLEPNLLIGNAVCSAKDEIKFRLVNPTAVAIDPAAQMYYFVQF